MGVLCMGGQAVAAGAAPQVPVPEAELVDQLRHKRTGQHRVPR